MTPSLKTGMWLVAARFGLAAVAVLFMSRANAMGELPAGTAVTLTSISAPDAEIDTNLLGKWRTPSIGKWAPVTLELRRSPTLINRYEVHMPSYFARPVEGRLVRLPKEGRGSSDKKNKLTVLECSVGVRAEDTGLLLPARHFFGIRLEGERLIVSLLSVQLGYMALTGGGSHGASWIKQVLETTPAGPVAVVVADGNHIDDQLRLADKLIRPQWQLTFERER